jgi:tetratricopeptide (TPR) repeat protein
MLNMMQSLLDMDSAEIDASYQAADKATDLWESGDRNEALKHLLETFKTNQFCGPDWSWLAATWQLSMGCDSSAALELLRKHPSDMPEWGFTNAIALFKQQGDNVVSRAALTSAIEEGSPIAGKLLGKIDDDIVDGIDLKGIESYPQNAIKIWEETPHALKWLQDSFDRFVEPSGEKPIEPDSTNRRHYKLWSDNYQFAVNASRKEHTRKEAKKFFLSALKEARHFGALSWEFDSTVSRLSLSFVDARTQLEAAVREQVTAAKNLEQTNPLKAMRAYARIAERFDRMENVAEADDCYRAALRILHSLSETDRDLVDNCERAELLADAVAYRLDEEELRRSIALLEESLELRVSYLGPKHGELLDTMLDLHKCLVSLEGDASDRAEVLKTRMLLIEPLANEIIEAHHAGR